MSDFESVSTEVTELVNSWEPILNTLPEDTYSHRTNSQNRTIRMIVGHLIDSSSNNTHRIVHLQNQEPPLIFPNYATFGNNDKWIAIQDYQNEEWTNLVQLWKYSLLHIGHIIRNVNNEKLKNEWISGPGETVSLEKMIVDFPRHLKLHLDEIEELIRNSV
jgi:hypothetical protein